MKKILALAALFIFALAIAAWGMELGNGITYTDDRPVLTKAEEEHAVEGMSAGGIREENPLSNGVTYFEKAAPALHEVAAPAPEVSNGITSF